MLAGAHQKCYYGLILALFLYIYINKHTTFQMVIASCVDVSQENIPHRSWKSSIVCNVSRVHVVYPSLEGRISTNQRIGTMALAEQVEVVSD